MNISSIANYSSILGLIISLVLLFYAKRVKNTLISFIDFKQWKKVRKNILDELSGCLKMVNEDNILDGALMSDIVRLISTLENFPFQFGNKNKKHLKRVKKNLDQPSNLVDRKKLTNELAIICGKLSKEEEFLDG